MQLFGVVAAPGYGSLVLLLVLFGRSAQGLLWVLRRGGMARVGRCVAGDGGSARVKGLISVEGRGRCRIFGRSDRLDGK